MNVQDLGSIGELVSGIAVVISLIYLSLQIRSNSRETRFDSLLRIREFTAEHQKILTDPQRARIWRMALGDPDSLTDNERISSYSMVTIVVNNVEARLLYEKSHGISTNAFGAETDSVKAFGRSPGFSRWWKNARPTYGPEMIAYVEAQMSDADT